MIAKRFGLTLGCVLLLSASFAVGEERISVKKGNVRATDGVNIVYELRGKGVTTLVFLHGWCGDRQWWKHQVDAFAPDFTVVTVDQAGHGESGKDRKEWTVHGLADDVAALVKELKVKRVILVGHSMGGPVALAAAKKLPETVVAVIGVDTLHNAEFKWPEEQAKQFLEGFDRDFKGTLRFGLKAMFPEKADPELVKWITERAEVQDPKMGAGLMRDMAKLDAKVLLKEAKVPVRCINSAGEFPLAMRTATDINQKYADFKAVTIKDVGHFPMLEKPREFNETLVDVLLEFRPKK